MRYINATFAFFAVFLIASCSFKSDTYKQLVHVDSLLLGHNYVDSAKILLKNIEPQTKKDSAYYNILQVSVNYQSESPVKSFSGINASIKFYTDNYDARQLAYAHYYKAMIFIDADSIVTEMFSLLKNAEQNARKTTDFRLLDRIYSALTFLNSRFGEFNEALNCARKELFYSQKINDNYCIAYALINLAITHCYMANTDSSNYYIQQCKEYADEFENKDKSFIYNYIGETLMYGNPSSAKQYFKSALKYHKLAEAYMNLAKLYFAENQNELAQKYCDSALISTSLLAKKETLTLVAEHYYKNKDIEKYKKATDDIMETQSKISQEKENRKMLELQKKFDYEKQQAEYNKNKMVLIFVISILSILIIALVLFHKLRVHKIRERELELENQNSQLYSNLMSMTANEENYKKQIIELETENQTLSTQKSDLSRTISNNKTRITILQNKVDQLSTQKYEYIEIGKTIYHRIEQNQTITMYDDKWANCVYYFAMNMDDSIFEDYNNLTINDKIFIITDDFLKKTDDEIAEILAISSVTVRTRRSKIRKKRIDMAA